MRIAARGFPVLAPAILALTIPVLAILAVAGNSFAAPPAPAERPAVVHRPSVEVKSAPDFASPTVATLNRNDTVRIAAQQGLWFRLDLAGKPGFVRVNDVRMASAGPAAAGVRAAVVGKAGKGRATETATVRGLDENDLKVAAFDPAQLASMQSYRVDATAAAREARARGWQETTLAYAGEAQPAAGKRNTTSRAQKRGGLALMRGVLSGIGVGSPVADSAIDVADAGASKSDAEQTEEELQLGPEIAGRVLGAVPLWNDPAAQRRVNLLGRWMASHTTRPELPWTFGILDSAEVNAFAAPGGYVLVTRGLYDLAASDAELAGALGHEISHIVERDHYNVIRKQAMTAAGTGAAVSQVNLGGGIADGFLRGYLQKFGASVLAARLDQSVEYRSDEAAGYYLARSGFNPLALYSVLQHLAALGGASPRMSSLTRTHPAMAARLDRLDQRGYAGLQRYTDRQ